MNAQTKESLKNAAYIIIGLFSCSLGYCMFLVPNEIAPGGFTGIGQLCNALFGINVGTMALILNVPLFAVSMRSMGIKFGVKSLVASIGLSLFIDYLPIGAVTDDLLLATVFGALLGGVGFGLILRGNATTGGTEMAARLLKLKFQGLSIGSLCLALDVAVTLGYALCFRDLSRAMYGIVALYILSLLIDRVVYGPNAAKVAYIISEQYEAITRELLQLDRGVTLLEGKGAWSGKDKRVILCAFGRRQVIPVKKLVQAVDPNAFVIVCDAHEILGEGFGTYDPTGL